MANLFEQQETDEFGGVLVEDVDEFGGVLAEGVEAPGELTAVSGTMQGVNVMLANAAGAFVDVAGGAMNLAREAAGLPPITKPILGSESIKAGLRSIGVLKDVELEEMSRPAQIGYRVGEVIGGSIPFAAAPLVAVRMGVKGAQFLQPILNAARATPGRFTAIEVGGILGAAQGAGLAEAADPGDDLTRLLSEIAGGFINPAGTVVRLGGSTFGAVKRFATGFSKAGREAEAARVIRAIVDETGQNAETLARQLEVPDGFNLTSGRKTGDPALLALESKIAQRNAEFSRNADETTKEAFASMRGLIDELVKTGRPADLRAAAIVRQKYFDDLLSQRFKDAEQQVAEVAAKIGGKDRAAAGQVVFDTLNVAMREARNVERALWGKIPRDIDLIPNGLRAAKAAVRERLLKEETFPLASTINRILKTNKTTTGELLKLRSRLLASSRDSRAQSKFSDASITDELAGSILDDMSNIDVPSVDDARQFSRALNKTFSQTFAGRALAKNRQAGQKISPETLLDRAFGGGGVAADVRFRELVEAGDFSSMFLGDVVRGESELFLRTVASQVLENGKVNATKLRGLVANNPQLLERFPLLKQDLNDVTRAQTLLDKVIASNRIASQKVMERAAFARLIDVEDPARAIDGLLRGKTPQRDFRQLARLAKNSGEGAVEGLKTSVFDNALSAAGKGEAGFSFSKFGKALFDPKGRLSPIELMRSENVISIGETNRLRQLIDRGVKLEKAIKLKPKLDELIGEPDAFFDFAVRVLGANIGGASVVGQSAGAPIVAAGAGSKLARKLFEKVPVTKIMDVLTEAAKNPQFMAVLLRKGKTAAQRKVIRRQINAFLLQTGLIDENE